ncbi:MAG: ribosome biogenesis GTP-binding protein YsxC [Elusimicrobia bacterium RIFOXYD12_FULL_66_9]|nr:MAG: ribosome biogenesis GTP-binding protein YsxC [Elusimicrobia bacterium RIFOXYD12_FULL_66_9]
MAASPVSFLVSETDPSRLGPSSGEVAFVGRSNAGKSTLLNAMFLKGLARVSGTPGCTRTINVYQVEKGRWLVDLPGYGFASGKADSRAGWGEMIEGYLTGRRNLRMIFILLDAKVGPTKLDLEMLRWLQTQGLPWRVVATKCDQVKRSRQQAQRRDVADAAGVLPENVAWVSSLENLGVRELRREVSALLEG